MKLKKIMKKIQKRKIKKSQLALFLYWNFVIKFIKYGKQNVKLKKERSWYEKKEKGKFI